MKTEKRSEMLTFRCTSLQAHIVRALAAAESTTVTDLLLELIAERAEQRFQSGLLIREGKS